MQQGAPRAEAMNYSPSLDSKPTLEATERNGAASVWQDRRTSGGANAATTPLDGRSAKFRGWKNVLALSLGWLFLYSGYLPMNSIQSSLNGDDGLGPVSLSVQNAAEMMGNLFVSNLIVHRIGTKWTMAGGAALFTAYIAANFYPTWGTLIPTAALSGLGASMTWIAQNTYLTRLSHYYSRATHTDFTTVNIRFFGTFYSIYYSSNIVGNVASSFLLGADFEPDNETFAYDPMALCGADYCNEDLGTYFHPEEELLMMDAGGGDADGAPLSSDTSTGYSSANESTMVPAAEPVINTLRPNLSQIYSLCGFCLGSTLVATLILTLMVDPLSTLDPTGSAGAAEGKARGSWQLLGATFRHLLHPYMLLLLPLTFYNGLDNDFMYNEFTKAFVTCPLGMEYIGFVAACFGIFGPISSLVSGWLSTKRTRYLPFAVAGLAHLSTGVAMLYWNPVPGTQISVYIMASVWGIGSGIWCSQLNAFYGIVFPDSLEAAFANFHLWNSIASTVLYASSHVVCTMMKIYIMIGVVSLGLLGFSVVAVSRHLVHRRAARKELGKAVVQLTCINNLNFE